MLPQGARTAVTGSAGLERDAVQTSPRRCVGDAAAYLFLDGHVQTLPFAKTWGDASTNLHDPFK
jgi:prepilin-type processing-associated H-X9-DG protein